MKKILKPLVTLSIAFLLAMTSFHATADHKRGYDRNYSQWNYHKDYRKHWKQQKKLHKQHQKFLRHQRRQFNRDFYPRYYNSGYYYDRPRRYRNYGHLDGFIGGALGGTIGGFAGHQLSNGDPLATGVGAALGAYLGYEITD